MALNKVIACGYVLSCFAFRPFWGHVPEPSNQPPLNASVTDFTVFREELRQVMYDSLAAQDWHYQRNRGDAITIGYRIDPKGGCPWVRAEAILDNCPIARTSDYIIINPRPTEWSPGYAANNTELRNLELPNGTMSVFWHWEHDNVFLRNRAYFGFGSWQWISPGVIEDTVTAFHGDLQPPSGLPTGLRSTEWAMHRLSAIGPNSSKYEVLWYDDLHGIVPCRLTISSQANALRKEVKLYRDILAVDTLIL